MVMGSVGRQTPATNLKSGFTDSDIDNVTLDQFGEQLVLSVGKSKRPSQPYRQIAAFYACVRAVSEAVKNMPFNVATRDDELVESGDVIDLVNCPYPGLTGEDFWDVTIAHLMTSGCYWVAHDWKAGVPISKIEPVGNDRCKPKYDRVTGDLTHYRYRPMVGGEWQDLPPEAVEPVIVPDIYSSGLYDALGPTKPAEMALYQINGADGANINTLDNSGEPGMVFEMGDEPDDKVKKDFRGQVRQRWREPENRNMPIVLWGNSKLHEITRKFAEMEFSKLKQMSIIDVCIVCRTPPAVIGYGTADKLNPGEDSKAHKVWIESTVLPLGHMLSRKFTLFALSTYQQRSASRTFRSYIGRARRSIVDLASPGYKQMRSWAARHRVGVKQHNALLGRDGVTQQALAFFGYFDSTSVQTVQEAMFDRAERAVLFSEKLGATQAEVIDVFDLPIPSDHPWQKHAYKEMGRVPYDAPLPGDDDPDGSIAPAPPPEDEAEEDKKWRPLTRDLAEIDRRAVADLWRSWRSSWKGLETQAVSAIGTHFGTLGDEMIAAVKKLSEEIDASAKADTGRTRVKASNPDWDLYGDGDLTRNIDVEVKADVVDLVGKILFSLAIADKKIVAASTAIFQTSYRLGGEQSIDEHAEATGQDADDLAPFQLDNGRARQALKTRQIKIKGTNRTFRERVRKQLLEGFSKGETHVQLAKRIRHEKGIGARRAKSIAMTEVGAAVEQGRHEGRRLMGVPKKSWIWSQRETARGWHKLTSQSTVATPIPNDEAFVLAVTGATAMHPRAATLSAKESINCGCFVVGRYDNDNFNELAYQTIDHGFLDVERMTQRIERRAA